MRELVFLVLLVGTCLATAFLNRLAGSGFGLFVRLFWVAAAMFEIVFAWDRWQVAATFMVAYVLWRAPPLARWETMDYIVRVKPPPSRFENFIEHFSRSEQSAMSLRMLLAVPGALLVYIALGDIQFFDLFSAFGLAGALWLAYAVGWIVKPSNGVPLAEWLCGAVWGVWIVGAI